MNKYSLTHKDRNTFKEKANRIEKLVDIFPKYCAKIKIKNTK